MVLKHGREEKTKTQQELWRRRQAVQLAAQLPDDPQDALAILEYVRSLVENFLMAPQEPQEAPVLPFRRSEAQSSVSAIS